ncbi:hypothetical protein MAR_023843 [Mya arenaria]|uniref:Mitochondria-eating protein n=1 Tax=Mya arenaria TaxID=6604 RepID=A0ABY7DX09_MYAAR|nr:hypothetical protein MAR_023843 [Mya arenaria]
MGNYQSQRTAVGHSMYEVPLDSLLTYIDHELNLWRDLVDNVKREKKYDHEGRTLIENAYIHYYNHETKVFQFCEKKASLLVKQTETAADLLFDEFSRSALQETTKNMPAGKKALTMDPKQLAEMRGGLQREGSSMEDLQMQRKWKPKIKPDGKQTYIQTKIQPRTINVEDKLKQMRKGLAESLVPSVQKAYIKTYWDNECLRAIKPFIKRCIFIAWMMVVQTPPMCFDRELQEGATFDAARYRQYTSSGHIVHFLVWPALLLYRDGPVVCKGVAQGKKK